MTPFKIISVTYHIAEQCLHLFPTYQTLDHKILTRLDETQGKGVLGHQNTGPLLEDSPTFLSPRL